MSPIKAIVSKGLYTPICRHELPCCRGRPLPIGLSNCFSKSRFPV